MYSRMGTIIRTLWGGDKNERVLGRSRKEGECVHTHFRFLHHSELNAEHR